MNQALYWYKRAAAHGVAAAEYNLAVLYRDGRGVEKDEAQSTRLMNLAASHGFGLAAGMATITQSAGLP